MPFKVLAVALIAALVVVALVVGWRTGTAYADRKARGKADHQAEKRDADSGPKPISTTFRKLLRRHPFDVKLSTGWFRRPGDILYIAHHLAVRPDGRWVITGATEAGQRFEITIDAPTSLDRFDEYAVVHTNGSATVTLFGSNHEPTAVRPSPGLIEFHWHREAN